MPQEPEDSLREKRWKRKEPGRDKAWTGGSSWNKTLSFLSIKTGAYYLQQDAIFMPSSMLWNWIFSTSSSTRVSLSVRTGVFISNSHAGIVRVGVRGTAIIQCRQVNETSHEVRGKNTSQFFPTVNCEFLVLQLLGLLSPAVLNQSFIKSLLLSECKSTTCDRQKILLLALACQFIRGEPHNQKSCTIQMKLCCPSPGWIKSAFSTWDGQ